MTTSPRLISSKRNFWTRLGLSALVFAGSLAVFGFAPEKGVDTPSALSSAGGRTPYKNWGLMNSQGKSHIDAIDAWKIEEGDPNVIVAVIDTGIDAGHPALKKNIWHSGLTKVL